MSDCVPSPDSDSSYASSSGSHSSTDSSSSPTCELSLLERLIRTHPVWFLPSLQRSGALHLLQGRDVGNFIVRSSTQPMTMAVSVKLPGNHVEHYLLKAVDNRIALENSTHTFETVHQLIAHYCGISDEIPVCLRVPSAIAEATSRQQLTSLALLGQEFWSHSSSGSGKELISPSDIEIGKNCVSSGLGSQSSSSQNSLCDVNRKPCRPTTLELGTNGVGGVGSGIATPPPVPPRWSRSALLTPLSLPSSVQSTPSEVQSTFSEKSGRPGKKKKRNSGGNKAESIHYKDTEILDLFKGKKTSYDDKASDYEDIWSPNHERSHTPRLSTFKPDLIASSRASDLDNSHNNIYNGKSPLQNNPALRNENQFPSFTLAVNNINSKDDVDVIVQNKNVQNHRLSFNGQNCNQILTTGVDKVNTDKGDSKESLDKSNNKKNSGLYSEPVDSIAFRRLGNHRHSEPNIRWSQPLLSLVKVEIVGADENECNTTAVSTDVVNEKGGSGLIAQHQHNQLMSSSFHAQIHQHHLFKQHHRSSLANVNVSPNGNGGSVRSINNNNGKQVVILNRNSNGSIHSQRNHSLACASMDNLCHLRDLKKRAKKYNCGGESGDEERPFKKEATEAPKVPAKPKKRSDLDKERREEREMLDISNNKSWRLDNSWEFVMWEKDEEQRLADGSLKFPLSTPPNSPFLVEEGMVNGFGLGLGMEGGLIVRPNRPSGENNSGSNSQNEDSLNSTHKTSSGFNSSNSNINRFSRYDNLESVRTEDENSGDEFHTDGDVEEKISSPWDSSKWEHLLRLVSESTQQLDSLQMAENNLNNRRNLNLFQGDRRFIAGLKDIDEKLLSTDSRQRVSKILEVSGNVDKASKAISSVVRELSDKENGFFGPTLKSFISCTIAAKIQDPHKVMRNVRQFISGMKNYLVGVSGESIELRAEIKKQTEILSDCEFLNIDAILEEVLVDLVISPLNLHIRGLIDVHHAKNEEPLKLNKLGSGSLMWNDKNSETKCHQGQSLSQQELAKQETTDKLKKIYVGLEDSVSPIKKLDKWNEFVCQVQDMENYSSESFLPLLAEMLGIVCTSNLPSHVDYMIGLLPHSLAEQNNYSLSLLQSAVSALRAKSDCRKGSSTLTSVRVIVPDERNGTLIRKMVPVRETTTNREVAKMVASKLGIANTGDYILVRIKNGEEKLCPEAELVSQFVEDSATALAYKRIDAKIGWPQKIS